MSAQPWSDFPKIDELELSDILFKIILVLVVTSPPFNVNITVFESFFTLTPLMSKAFMLSVIIRKSMQRQFLHPEPLLNY